LESRKLSLRIIGGPDGGRFGSRRLSLPIGGVPILGGPWCLGDKIPEPYGSDGCDGGAALWLRCGDTPLVNGGGRW
jgi:hypothetical protein